MGTGTGMLGFGRIAGVAEAVNDLGHWPFPQHRGLREDRRDSTTDRKWLRLMSTR